MQVGSAFLYPDLMDAASLEEVSNVSKSLLHCLWLKHCLWLQRFFGYLVCWWGNWGTEVGCDGPEGAHQGWGSSCCSSAPADPWAALEMFPNMFAKLHLRVDRRGWSDSIGYGLMGELLGFGWVVCFLNWFQYYCGFCFTAAWKNRNVMLLKSHF